MCVCSGGRKNRELEERTLFMALIWGETLHHLHSDAG